MSSTVNVYLVATPLQYLASEVIVNTFEKTTRNYLFYVRPDIHSVVNHDLWAGVQYLPWPKKYPKKGIFGKMRRIRENLGKVGEVCNDAAKIRLHLWVLRSEATNYHINDLLAKYPRADFSVRIIPDGTLGLFRRALRWYEIIGLYIRKARRILYPSLNYYVFSGDRIGSDASVVDRVYCLKGIPHEFDTSKTCVLPNLIKLRAHKKNKLKCALVLSQPFYQLGKCSKQEIEAVTKGIHAYLGNQNIDVVDYKQHPYDRIKELHHPDYRELHIDIPLEKYLGDHYYDLIIGVDSAALFLAKSMFGETNRIVSFGKNVIHGSSGIISPRKARKRSKANSALRRQMDKVGIEQLDCD